MFKICAQPLKIFLHSQISTHVHERTVNSRVDSEMQALQIRFLALFYSLLCVTNHTVSSFSFMA